MNLHRFIAGASIAIIGACGGDSTNGDAGPDATQGNDAGSDVVGTDASADVTGDVDKTCVPVEGGLPCDGLHVACGNSECDAGSQICCVTSNGTKEACAVPPPTDGGKPPPNTCAGSKMACDEAADCPNGQVCCGFVGPIDAGGFNTTCQTSCGTGLQFCHGSAECVTGTCTVTPNCHGVTIETCGSFCP
jgi:hypothetical protein